MTKRFIFQVLIGMVLMSLNLSKDFMPLGKMYLKAKACELNIDDVLKHKSISGLKSFLSNDELNELQKLKNDYCESITKTIK